MKDGFTKPLQRFAWALIEDDNRRGLTTFDERLPIYWLRKIAAEECHRRNFSGANLRVAKVTILSVHP